MVYCLGDSHARVFDNIQERHLLNGVTLDVTWVLGATALGLANPNSRSNALVDFRKALRGVPRDAPLVVLLGEIDCGYLIWYRADKYGHDVREEFEASLATYTGFLTELQHGGRSSIIVAVVPPPAVEDYADWSGLDNARKHVKATLGERTRLTQEYNDRLRDWAHAHGAQVLDYESDVLDADSGRIRPELMHDDPLNHHLHRERFPEVVAARMRELGLG